MLIRFVGSFHIIGSQCEGFRLVCPANMTNVEIIRLVKTPGWN